MNPEVEQTAGGQPAVFVSAGPVMAEEPPVASELSAAQFKLFSTVEDQIENIVKVQAAQ